METLFNINGTQYRLIDKSIKNGLYQIIAEPFVDVEPDIKRETENLLQNIFYNKHSKIIVSELIVDWFLLCKAKLKQNTNLLFSVKKDKFAQQLRTLERAGESWHDIIAVLSHSFHHRFWRESLINTYHKLSKPTENTGIPPYYQLKDSLEIQLSEQNPMSHQAKETQENDL